MVCPKCGAEVQEDWIFCLVCGARVDGKKSCPKCKKLIDGNAVYCTFCGERVDGKKVCRKCGTAYDGAFCPNCGVRVGKDSENKAKNAEHVIALGERYNTVERVLSPSLLLLSILLMFIGAFLIQVKLTGTNLISDALSALGVSDKCTVFSFFGDAFEEVNDYISTCKVTFDGLEFGLKVPIIITLIVIIANFVVSAICFVYALVKYIKGVATNEKVDLVKPFSYNLLTFLVTALLIFGYNYFNINVIDSGVTMLKINVRSALTAPTIVFLVFVAVFGISVYVLDAVKKGKEIIPKENITKWILVFVALILLVVNMFFTNSKMLKMSGKGNEIEMGAVQSLQFYWMQINTLYATDANSSLTSTWDTILASSMICYLASVALTIVGGFILLKFLRNLFSDVNNNCSTVVLSATQLGIAIVYLVFAIVMKNNINDSLNIDGSAEISITNTIVVLVMSAVVFIVSIAYSIVRKHQRKEIVD